MKSKIILSGLFLTGAVSCASFKPFVLTNAFINPETTTDVDYEDLNFSYALFNQYASGLSYTLRMDYSFIQSNQINFGVSTDIDGVFNWFTSWDTITNNFAEAELNNVWRARFNRVFFDRDFDRVTKKARAANKIQFWNQMVNNTYLSIKVKSAITYSVNIGSVYAAFKANVGATVDGYNMYIVFRDVNDAVLQTVLLDQDRSNIQRDRVYGVSNIITGVRSFDFYIEWVDTPPQGGGLFTQLTEFYEFNLFTQLSEISIPDDVSGDRFGFEFVAVEWWNILGHLQNFAWWIVNKSPIAPVFEWLDTYVLTWVNGLITFITGVFNL